MGKVLLYIIAGLFVYSFAQGQTRQARVDSLRNVLASSIADSSRVKVLINTGRQYIGNHTDSALYFFQEAEVLAKAINWPAGRLMHMGAYSELLHFQAKYDEALALNRQALQLALKTGNKLAIARAYNNVGASYHYRTQFQECLENYLKAMAIYEELQYELGLRVLYANLCGLYGQFLNQPERAVEYGQKSLHLSLKSGDSFTAARALNSTGLALFYLKKYEKALEAYKQAYQIGKENDQLHVLSSVAINMSLLYQTQQNYSKAIATYKEALKFSRAIENRKDEVSSLEGLSRCYLQTKNYALATRTVTEAIAISREHNFTGLWASLTLIMSDIELAKGNINTYLALRAKSDSLKEQVWNEKMRLNLQELETKFDTEKKENQIIALQQEKQIQALSLRQKNTLNYIFFGTTLSLLTVGFLFYRNVRNQKTISRQKEALQEQRIKELEQAQQLLAANAVLQGQESERSRLAKDLHDGLGGMLSGIKLMLSSLKSSRLLSGEDASLFTRALDQLDGTTTELRRVAHNMMPEALSRYGLLQALQDYCTSLGQSARIPIELQSIGMDSRLEASTEIMLYRIGQELLNNVVKHAEATEVFVQLIRTDNHITFSVEDNGNGFDVQQVRQGIGLSNIRTRAYYLGANLDIHSTAGVGTTVSIDFILKPTPVFTATNQPVFT